MAKIDVDVAVIGGSNAGLAAALTLGRSNRKAIVFDTCSPRNKPAAHIHNFFTRDGMPPGELIEVGKEQLNLYPSVQILNKEITKTEKKENYFLLIAEDGSLYSVRKIIFATGVTDVLMDIKGIKELWGKKIFNCPYCHGWEVRDQPIAVIINGSIIFELAVTVSNWNKDILFFVNGTEISADKELLITQKGWQIIKTPIRELIDDGNYIRIILSDGTEIIRAAAYSKPIALQFNNQLARQLGCSLHESGSVLTDGSLQTTIPGVFAAGDIMQPAFHQVSAAAAAGHLAAMMCNNQLTGEDFEN